MKKTTKTEFLRTLKFTLVSISAGLIQIGSYALIRLFAPYPEGSWQNYVVAYTPSLLLSVIWNFTVNRKYTFKAANDVKVAMLLVLAFYAVFTPLSTVIGGKVVDGGGNSELVFAVTLLCNFALEFLYTRFVVYGNSCDTATVEKRKNKESLDETVDGVEGKEEKDII